MFTIEQILEQYKELLRSYKASLEFQLGRGEGQRSRVLRRGSGTVLDSREDQIERMQKFLGMTPEEIQRINEEMGYQPRSRE